MDRRAGGLTAASPLPHARRAGGEDAPALLRLRSTMFDAMGIATCGPDAPWRAAAETWFLDRLEATDSFAAFVVDDPVHGVVSAACGSCDSRPPGPRGLSAVRGQIFNVATEPDQRRHGYARACLDALIAWFARDTFVELVELTATAHGLGLYESLGFRPRTQPVMRMSLPR
jgi:ribosomal protein S18 acetylase RimI-like enzyme